MSTPRVGRLPPRYKFLLNPHEHLKLSTCASCDKLTYPRKFALFIHVADFGAYAQGITCKYCSRCELIICHQVDLEVQMEHGFRQIKPEVVGNEYLVIGTVDLKIWKAGLAGKPGTLGELIEHLSDFKKVITLNFDPGGWRHDSADPSDYMIPHEMAAKALVTPWRHHPGV